MPQSGTEMAFAAIHRANDVAALPLPPRLPFSPFNFKGVVPQPHGRGGAHVVYERRAPAAWLVGVFPGEETAVRNMLADEAPRRSLRRGGGETPLLCAREHLFQKALTPSDVGNLNRLVVPKQHAEKHFLVKRNPLMAAGMGVLLDFEDGEGNTWRLRYSYCRSSRIYILTKGWRRFVRAKELQPGDTVAFYRSAIGPFKKLHIEFWKPQNKQDDAVAIDSHVVKLFGVDIARG